MSDYQEQSVWEIIAKISRYCKRADEYYQETGDLDLDSYRVIETLAHEINLRAQTKTKEWA